MLEILKVFFEKILGVKAVQSTTSSARRVQLQSSKLQKAADLPVIDSEFNLLWSIEHDQDFEDVLHYQFTTDGGIGLHHEIATFEDSLRAEELVAMLRTKYGDKLLEIRLAPGVGIYIGGCNTSAFEKFVKYVCDQGYERVHQDVEFVKRDGATREILVPEITFKLMNRT